MLSEGARREDSRLVVGYQIRQRLQDDLLLGRLTEHSPRYSHLLLVHQAPVKNTLVLAVAEDLDGVADVHENGVGHAFRRHPLAVVEKLQAGHHVVKQEGERTNVRVSFNPKSQLWLWTCWVVVDLHLKQKLLHPTNFLLKPPFLQTQSQR